MKIIYIACTIIKADDSFRLATDAALNHHKAKMLTIVMIMMQKTVLNHHNNSNCVMRNYNVYISDIILLNLLDLQDSA